MAPPAAWNAHVMATLKALKAKNPSATLKQAMIAAKKTYKKSNAKPLKHIKPVEDSADSTEVEDSM